MIIYIKSQGTKIIKEGRHLLVKKGNDTYHTLFTYKLNQILLFGNIEITHNALCVLMQNNIDTVYLTRYGRYLGRIASPESKNVFLHKRQYKLLDDNKFALKMAKDIVAGKLTNMVTLMMRIKRSRGCRNAGDKARQIRKLLNGLYEAETIDSVRGYEGRGAAIYFSGFCHGFTGNTNFTKRVRRPPTDPVNSVLSLLYTFLMNRVYSAVRIAGLDPYPGFLHVIDYGRYSLVLDLMEEFRPAVVDTLVFSLFNLKILQETDFRFEVPAASSDPEGETLNDSIPDVNADTLGMMTLNKENNKEVQNNFDIPEQKIDTVPGAAASHVTGKYPVKLNPVAFGRVIAAFEKKLSAFFYYPPAGKNMTYGDVIIYQAAQYRKVIEGTAETYQPMILK